MFTQAMLSQLSVHADSCILGSDVTEVRGVPALVERLAAVHGTQRIVVVLDQNLDFDESPETIFGTDLCRELRAKGFDGLVAILSADDDSASQDKFIRSGANLTFGKSPEDQLIFPARLADAFHRLHPAAAATKASHPVDGWLPAQRMSR